MAKTKDMDIMGMVKRIAGEVHKKVRIASIGEVDEDASAPQVVFATMAGQAGLLSAVVSNLADLYSCQMISFEAFERLRPLADTLCRDVQIELQKQLVRDLSEAGADIDVEAALEKLDATEGDAFYGTGDEVMH